MGDEPKCRHDSAVADRKVIHDVNTHGWHVVMVEAEGEYPGWAFSVGIYHNYRHPEIVMFGLGQTVMHQVINNIGDQVRSGASFGVDARYSDLLGDYACILKPVDAAWYAWVLGYARWFYKGDEFPALQCFWPDKQHHFPWEEKFSTSLVNLQPLLYHSDAHLARAEKLLESMQDTAK